MRRDKLGMRAPLVVAVALLGGVLVGAATGPVVADTVSRARGYAYGASENALNDPITAAPEVTAEVPAGAGQAPVTVARDRDELLAVSTLVRVATIEADACINEGVSAKLQLEINRARILARGATPAADADAVNSGPNDEDPETVNVRTDPNLLDGCVRPLSATSSSPGATPAPTATGSPGPAPSPSPACSGATASPAGTVCSTNAPLWNGRGYARGELDPVLSTAAGDLHSEAVARCVNNRVQVATGARLVGRIGTQSDNPQRPNQPIDVAGLNLVTGSFATFWETNWDPRTNTTTDGSETVWVNALHIITPTEDIIISHAEATAECPSTPTGAPTSTVTLGPPPTPTPPEGGFPRDVNLSPSKSQVLYSKLFTLSGSVSPATQFETPRRCVEGITVTIRRDPIGGPEEFLDVGTVVTDTNGNFTFNYQADVNSQWLAFIDKDNPTDCALAVSSAKPVLVKPFVRLKLSQRFIERGKTVRMRSSLEPCLDHAGTRMKLKRAFEGEVVEIDTKALDANCLVEFFIKANFNEAVFQTSWPKQSDALQTGQSRPKVVQTRHD